MNPDDIFWIAFWKIVFGLSALIALCITGYNIVEQATEYEIARHLEGRALEFYTCVSKSSQYTQALCHEIWEK